MDDAARFPYTQIGVGVGGSMPMMPLTLSLDGSASVEARALLDTGATVNVLPFDLGLQLGADWDAQKTSLTLTGNLARFEARAILLQATIDRFVPVKLAFAWSKSPDVPVLLGQVNFFREFDACSLAPKDTSRSGPEPTMTQIPPETLKRLHKLVRLAEELPDLERFSLPITRLTILKKMCEEKAVAQAFAFHMANLAFEEASCNSAPNRLDEETWARHMALMGSALKLMAVWLEDEDSDFRQEAYDLLKVMKDEQNDHRSVPFGAVRLIENSWMLQLEQALRSFWVHERERAYWIYQLARDHAETYEPSRGTGLNPSSLPRLKEIIAFWIDYYGVTPRAVDVNTETPDS